MNVFFNIRSVRRYDNKEIDRDTIVRIIEKAGQAPSGLNKQPWLYSVITNNEIKSEIREKCEKIEYDFYKKIGEKRKNFTSLNISPKKAFLTESPVIIVLFADKNAPYYKESVWLSVGWFFIAAAEEGLSSLTYTPEKMDFLNDILNISDNYIPQVILPLGIGNKKGKKIRKSLNEIVRFYE